MRCSNANRFVRRGARGFTFVELLAAMLFMAIVIPVAMEGIILANRVGVGAERKRAAALLADRKLSEAIVTESWRDGDQAGDFGEAWPGFSWMLSTEAWPEDAMRMVTVSVIYRVQERQYAERMTTLANETTTVATGESATIMQ